MGENVTLMSLSLLQSSILDASEASEGSHEASGSLAGVSLLLPLLVPRIVPVFLLTSTCLEICSMQTGRAR